jgi:hypothetical protein
MPQTANLNFAEAKTFVQRQIMLHSHMKSKRSPHENFWDELEAMFTPELYVARQAGNTGQGRRWGEDQWDGYPQQALHTWSKGIPGNMIYADFETTPWMTMKLNVRSLQQDPDVKKYCQERTEQVFWGLRRTNFYEINPQFCRYAGVVGCYLFPVTNHEDRSVQFVMEDPWYVWVERDIFGRLTRAHREINQTIQALADQFGAEALAPDRRRELGPSGRPYTEITVLHCIFPNPDWDTTALDASRKRYVECYIDLQRRWLMYAEGTDYLPIDWAVERAPRSVYPLTPAMFALTDAYGSDTISKALFGVALAAADPEMRISDTLRDTYKQGAGGHTFVEDPARDIIEQVRKDLRWPVSDQERQRLQAKTDLWFSVPYFRLLESIEGNPPTAYHIQQLQSEKATLLGPQVATYTRQVLDPAVDIVSQMENENDPIAMPDPIVEYLAEQAFRDLQRSGMTNLTEDDLLDYMSKHPSAFLEARYTGVLTVIQSQVVHARKYGEALEFMLAAKEIWPESKHVINAYPFFRNVLEGANLGADEIRSEDEYKQIVDTLQQSEDLAQQAQMEQAAGESYLKMTKAPERGSPADQVQQETAA